MKYSYIRLRKKEWRTIFRKVLQCTTISLSCHWKEIYFKLANNSYSKCILRQFVKWLISLISSRITLPIFWNILYLYGTYLLNKISQSKEVVLNIYILIKLEKFEGHSLIITFNYYLLPLGHYCGNGILLKVFLLLLLLLFLCVFNVHVIF